jgi:hypothetical protein
MRNMREGDFRVSLVNALHTGGNNCGLQSHDQIIHTVFFKHRLVTIKHFMEDAEAALQHTEHQLIIGPQSMIR